MNRWFKPAGIGLACLACCLPLVLAISGATTGATAVVGAWLGRNEALIVTGIGLVYLTVVLIRRSPSHHKETKTKRQEPTS